MSGIDGAIQGVCKETTDLIAHQIRETYLDTYYREQYLIQDNVGYYYRPRKMTEANVNAYLQHKLAGDTWQNRLKGHYRQYVRDTASIIRSGRANGIPKDEIRDTLRAITGRTGESGITYKIQRILRTECNAATNAATLSAFKQAKVKKYRYIAILDSVTCSHCRDILHNKVFEVKKAKAGINLPPMHPNCRCYIEPVIDYDVKQLIEKKGHKRCHMSYEAWYREYVQ